MGRPDILAAMAEQALAQYGRDLAAGGEPIYPQWAKDLQGMLAEREQLVAALREIVRISKPQFCMDGNAKVGAPNSTGYDFQLIARAALAAAGAA